MRKVVVLISIISLVLLAGCNYQQTPQVISLNKGLSFSPSALDGPGIADFFAKAPDVAKFISWQGDWVQLADTNSAAYLIINSSLGNNFTPVLVAQVFDQGTGKLLRPIDAKSTDTYMTALDKLFAVYKPKYLGIGIEVNILYETSPADFDSFVALFNKAYAKIKQLSPDTLVFTSFQLEHMKGLRGGLFGGKDDTSQAEWSIMDKLNKADFFSFTTYPGIVYDNPADLPNDYYSDISQHTDKAIAINESGWFRKAPDGWYASSPQEQADAINRIMSLLSPLHPVFTIWSFLYDPPVQQPVFATMGLLQDKDQATSPAWETWQNIP